MKDIYTREERLGITEPNILSMIGQGLLFAISLILMFLILLLLSV
jgi:hypothetical protein